MAKSGGWARRCLVNALLFTFLTSAFGTNLPECQQDVAEMVNALANIGADVSFSLQDCTPEGFSILDCCSDIIPIVTAAAEFSAVVSKSTEACGEIDNWCAVRVSESFKYISESAVTIVAAVSDCNASAVIPSPVTCAVDLFSLLDSLVYFTIKVDMSIKACNPSDTVGFESIRQYHGPDISAASSMRRRLQAVLSNINDMKSMLEKHWPLPNRTKESLSPDSLELLRSKATDIKEQADMFI